jgi:two-component system chemotaxis response regulator CheB
VETIKAIREFNRDIPIIIFSAQNINAANKTLKALEMGANDFVQKIEGSGDLNENLRMIESELVPKFKAFINKLRSTKNKLESESPTPTIRKSTRYRADFNPDLICIGSSTGGPETLKTIFKELKPNINKPFLLVQHMPPIFTTQLASALDKCSELSVSEAKDGDILKAGHCYIAPGDFHMSLIKKNNQYTIQLDKTEKVCYVRPAVDVMLNSVVDNFQGKVASFILTGMGNDGANGCKYLKEKNKGIVVIQDEDSCVVFGMPKAIYDLEIYDDMAPLSEISGIINDLT